MHIAFTDMHLMKKILLKKKNLRLLQNHAAYLFKSTKMRFKIQKKKAYFVLIFLNKFEY